MRRARRVLYLDLARGHADRWLCIFYHCTPASIRLRHIAGSQGNGSERCCSRASHRNCRAVGCNFKPYIGLHPDAEFGCAVNEGAQHKTPAETRSGQVPCNFRLKLSPAPCFCSHGRAQAARPIARLRHPSICSLHFTLCIRIEPRPDYIYGLQCPNTAAPRVSGRRPALMKCSLAGLLSVDCALTWSRQGKLYCRPAYWVL
ncbi:hypothetical protein B0H13DRAFT_977643 [Mycena leptocephala]|nr:hypothetical protein B0H13DRAFT_977643 [Mycena leptocephala]